MKILIIDDHALFREGLHYVLGELGTTITILEAADFKQAMQHVSTNPDLDLVLLDLDILGKDGLTILHLLAKAYPTMPVVILSATNQASDIQRSLDAGAMGYIPKDSGRTVMQKALRQVLSGGIYAPSNKMAGDLAAEQ